MAQMSQMTHLDFSVIFNMFKGDFGQKGYPFLRISFKNRPIFQKFRDFRGFRMAKTLKIA